MAFDSRHSSGGHEGHSTSLSILYALHSALFRRHGFYVEAADHNAWLLFARIGVV